MSYPQNYPNYPANYQYDDMKNDDTFIYSRSYGGSGSGYGHGGGGYGGGGGYEDQLVLLRPPPSRRNQGGLGQISDLVDIDYETLVMLISTHIYADIYLYLH